MLYTIIKAIHIIFMVSYFAGIFYLVRLFVYHQDAIQFNDTKKEILQTQYVWMMRRLWNIITVPAGIIMLVAGVVLIILNWNLMQTPWFHLKLTFLVCLAFYHYWCWKSILKYKNLKIENTKNLGLKLRYANEIATLILFLVVFTVILKQNVIEYGWQLLLGFIVFTFVIMLTVKIVNKVKK